MDLLLSAKQNAQAAQRFFRKLLSAPNPQSPRVINVAHNAAQPPADKPLPKMTELRQVKYLNLIEQDHRFIKRLTKSAMDFGSFNSARLTVRDEAMNIIRRHHHVKLFGVATLVPDSSPHYC